MVTFALKGTTLIINLSEELTKSAVMEIESQIDAELLKSKPVNIRFTFEDVWTYNKDSLYTLIKSYCKWLFLRHNGMFDGKVEVHKAPWLVVELLKEDKTKCTAMLQFN